MGKELVGMTAVQEDEDRLERVDVELRAPSLVLSVRLDEKTGRQLHRIARERGMRISELLREAATAYATAVEAERSRPYAVEYGTQKVSFGVVLVNSHGFARGPSEADLITAGTGWEGPSVRTSLAMSG